MTIKLTILLFSILTSSNSHALFHENRYFDFSIINNGNALPIKSDQEGLEAFFLSEDSNSIPQFYFQKLFTPVCADTLCKPVHITLIWDLLGKYKDYRVEESQPLTKLDHKPFLLEDYEKLHQTLLNHKSVLSAYSKENISDLLEVQSDAYPYGIDALSGATPQTIKNDVIEGALYTSYTLWRHCHGNIQMELLEYSRSQLLNTDLMHQMLLSEDIDFIDFALANLHRFDEMQFQSDFIQIIQNNQSFLANRVLDSLPASMISDQVFAKQLWTSYNQLPYNSQLLILENLSLNTNLPGNLIDSMQNAAIHANESQYVMFLKILFYQNYLTKAQGEICLDTAKTRKGSLSDQSIQSLNTSTCNKNRMALKSKTLQIVEP